MLKQDEFGRGIIRRTFDRVDDYRSEHPVKGALLIGAYGVGSLATALGVSLAITETSLGQKVIVEPLSDAVKVGGDALFGVDSGPSKPEPQFPEWGKPGLGATDIPTQPGEGYRYTYDESLTPYCAGRAALGPLCGSVSP